VAQHDYNIANQSGAAFRADLNNALAAIVSQNSGAAEPSTTYAYMPWADTTNGLFKIRNAANSAWITLYQLDGEWSAIPLEDGSATAPPLYFKDSGTDTGIFSPGADQFGIATAGVERVEYGTSEVVFNDGGLDYDFRVEGDTKANLFKVDAGTDAVSIDGNFRVEGDTKANLFKVDAGTDAVSIDGNFSVTGSFDIANLNGGPLAGFRNVIINGNPTINQRDYVSGTATSGANQYTLDRWRVVTSGENISFTDSADVRTVTAPAGGCEQVVEGLSIVSGTYTLNWTGTATATVDGSAVAKGGNVTLSGGTNATVKFSSGTFTKVQLEPGSVATSFEQRPIGTELALCQRYYSKTDAYIKMLSAGPVVLDTMQIHFHYPSEMRTAPTLSYLGSTIGSGLTLTGVTPRGFTFGGAPDAAGAVYAEVVASAEL